MKKIMIIILSIFLFVNLTSCKKKFKKAEISKETEQEIKEIYAEYYNSNNDDLINSSTVEIKYYLGDYNGKKCAYVKGDISKDNKKVKIKPYEIESPISSKYFRFKHIPETISVYYDGRYYTLQEANNAELFSDDELIQLSNYCIDSRIYLTL